MKKEFIAFSSKSYYCIHHVKHQAKIFVFQLLKRAESYYVNPLELLVQLILPIQGFSWKVRENVSLNFVPLLLKKNQNMQKNKKMQDKVTPHLIVRFVLIGKININMLVQNMQLCTRKEYVRVCAQNLRAKHSEKSEQRFFSLLFGLVSTDCKFQYQDMPWVFFPPKECFCAVVRCMYFFGT